MHIHSSPSAIHPFRKEWLRNRDVYIMAIPVVLYFLLFHYAPMYGAIIAFKDYSPGLGIWGSPWTGLENFRDFFGSIYFPQILGNTLTISLTNLLIGFPAPIILALMLNEVRSHIFKRTVQTISYIPHFISLMVVCGMILDFTAVDGLINDIIVFFGGERIPIMLQPELFVPVYITSDIWQGIGWGAIVYIAALTSIDQQLYEAATIDRANRLQQLWYITLPCLMPTIITMLLMRLGQIMNVGYEKIILLYNSNTYETADVISSYVYRKGLMDFSYSFSAAAGLFNSVINCSILIVCNGLCKRISGSSLW